MAENPEKFDAREWLKPAREATTKICKQRYIEFGCEGQAGKIKALAVTGARRSPLIPDVPTVQEAGVPGYEASAWHAVLAPRGTPQPVIQTLYTAIAKVLADPQLKARLAQDGIEAVGSEPQAFGQALNAEIDKWQKVVEDAGIKLE